MTGKRDLARRSENPDTPRVTSSRWKNERALGEIKLARDLLHLIRREPFGFWQHCQLIPAEARLREHVADVILVFHILYQLSLHGHLYPARARWKRQILDTRCLMADEGNVALLRWALDPRSRRRIGIGFV